MPRVRRSRSFRRRSGQNGRRSLFYAGEESRSLARARPPLPPGRQLPSTGVRAADARVAGETRTQRGIGRIPQGATRRGAVPLETGHRRGSLRAPRETGASPRRLEDWSLVPPILNGTRLIACADILLFEIQLRAHRLTERR